MNSAVKKPPEPVGVEAFLDWAERQPRGRFELIDGEIVAMSPERVRHALVKQEAAFALREAVRRAQLDCTVFPDGVTVVIDEHTVYEPDASVQCGALPDLDSMILDRPLIVLEVASPSTGVKDSTLKLGDYFTVPSIQHYLILEPARKLLVHHSRDGDAIKTRLLTQGRLRLDPPGLELSVADLFIDE